MEVIEVQRAKPEAYVPYLGRISAIGYSLKTSSVLETHLAKSWRGMMERCYGVDNKYASAGVFVCRSWHSVSNFIQDTATLPGWGKKLKAWDSYFLDKDYYASNCYSPATCVWLTSEENNTYRHNAVVIEATNPFRHTAIYLSVYACARALGCHPFAIQQQVGKGRLIKGATKLLGWQFEVYKGSRLYRYAL